MSLSIVPSATLATGLFLAALFILGFLVLRTVHRGRQIRTILAVIVGSGVFQALYGLFELTRDDPRILFYRKVFSPDSVTGTFVNRNHFSGYLEMIVPLALGLAIARMNMMTFGVKGFREKLLLWTSKGILVNVLILAAAVVMSLAIVLSNSRSGLVVLGFTVFLFLGFSVAAFSRTGFRQPWIGKTVRATFLCVTILAVSVGVGSTIRRFALDDLLHEDRPQYWANTVEIIGDFPLFGTGLGTFASAYDAYEKTSASEMQLVHAHNDFLEYAAELGLVGTVLLIGGVLYLAVSAYLAWREAAERAGAGARPGRHRLPRRDRPPRRHRFQPPHPGQHGPLHRRPVPDPGHGLLPEELRSALKKKILPIAGLAVLVLLQAAVARNARLCWRAKVATDPAAKERLLRRADAIFPWNGEVHLRARQGLFRARRRSPRGPGGARRPVPPVRRIVPPLAPPRSRLSGRPISSSPRRSST